MRYSNTVIYIVAAVVISHFLVGFIYLAYKLTKKKDKKEE
jgi:hypothetical protein